MTVGLLPHVLEWGIAVVLIVPKLLLLCFHGISESDEVAKLILSSVLKNGFEILYKGSS